MTNEAKARLKINKLLEDSGWIFFDSPNQRANVVVEQNVDFDVLGDDFEGDKGFIDYLLLDQQGKPLAVLEAKSESKDPVIGKQQAIDYALAKGCEYVILSNGNSSYFLELSKNAEELIINFPSQKQLSNLKIQKKAEPLLSVPADSDWIAKDQGAIAKEELC